MPQFIAKPYAIEAHQFDGSLSTLPLPFVARVAGVRSGGGRMVDTDDGERVCHPGDWLVRDIGGRFEVVPGQVFARRYDPAFQPEVALTGLTATFHGAPNGRDEDQPAYVDWFGLRFWRGKPTAVSAPAAVEALKLNSHFVVHDPHDPAPVRRGPGRPRKDQQTADAGPAVALVVTEGPSE